MDCEIDSAVKTAFQKLGYPAARDEQLEAAREFVKGRNVFISLPTGSGKSLCYGCLPLAYDYLQKDPSSTSIVVVVSLLKTLMLDQVDAFGTRYHALSWMLKFAAQPFKSARGTL